jgi:hypothetical protein
VKFLATRFADAVLDDHIFTVPGSSPDFADNQEKHHIGIAARTAEVNLLAPSAVAESQAKKGWRLFYWPGGEGGGSGFRAMSWRIRTISGSSISLVPPSSMISNLRVHNGSLHPSKPN